MAVEDVDGLQGAWQQLSFEADGNPSASDENAAANVTVFSANDFTVYGIDGSVMLRGAFSLNEELRPKTVDWIDAIGPDAGKTLPGIYELDGDRLRFVVGESGGPRPTRFATRLGETMRSFRRLAGKDVPNARDESGFREIALAQLVEDDCEQDDRSEDDFL